MKNFESFSYDSSMWEIIEGEHAYHFRSLVDFKEYIIAGQICGINQIESDTFIIMRNRCDDIYEIRREKLVDSEKIIEYSRWFRKYLFIDENTVLFDMPQCGNCVYSIKENKNNSLIEYISDNFIKENLNFVQTPIKFIYDEISGDIKYLYFSYRYDSRVVQEYLQILIDAKTLKIVPKIYSTLRKEYINLVGTVTLNSVFEEELKTIREIEEKLQADGRVSSEEFLKNMP